MKSRQRCQPDTEESIAVEDQQGLFLRQCTGLPDGPPGAQGFFLERYGIAASRKRLPEKIFKVIALVPQCEDKFFDTLLPEIIGDISDERPAVYRGQAFRQIRDGRPEPGAQSPRPQNRLFDHALKYCSSTSWP